MDLWERASYSDLHDAGGLLWEAASPLPALLDRSELTSRVISVALGWALRHFMERVSRESFLLLWLPWGWIYFVKGQRGFISRQSDILMLDCRLHPLGFIHAVSAAQGPEAVPIHSKGSLGLAWDCHICSRKYSQGRGCLRVKVSAKVRTGWRRFQFQRFQRRPCSSFT